MVNHPLLYLEHLSEPDLDLIARTTGPTRSAASLRAALAARPSLVDELLADPELYAAVFETGTDRLVPRISSFLAFGLLVHRSAADLMTTRYVLEWTAPRRRLPVFDVASLQAFLAPSAHRYFLIELLASYTKVASGSTWIRTRQGYRRRRFSELDPVRLADVVDRLPAASRPGGYRRLGDLALFLSGVFPDHTAGNPLGPVARRRLARSAGLPAATALRDPADLGFHELVGAAWYRRAVETAAGAVGTGPEYLLDIADHIDHARRCLNLVADRYLHGFEPGPMT